jgi:uncharacterized protein YcbX
MSEDSSPSPSRRLRVAELYVHPVKSGRAVRVDRAVVTPRGLAGDREFMVVDAQRGFLSQREHPALARLSARLEGDELALELSGQAEIRIDRRASGPSRTCEVWGDRVACVDLGEEAARLLESLLGVPARLVRMADDASRPVDPRFGAASDEVSFADGFPLLVTTSASIVAVSRRLERSVDATSFRPNLVVDGAEPFEEDVWTRIAIGDVELELVKPCARCSMVDVDPAHGSRRGDVLAALAKFRTARNKVFFGQNAIPRVLGELALGQPVRVLAARTA